MAHVMVPPKAVFTRLSPLMLNAGTSLPKLSKLLRVLFMCHLGRSPPYALPALRLASLGIKITKEIDYNNRFYENQSLKSDASLVFACYLLKVNLSYFII